MQQRGGCKGGNKVRSDMKRDLVHKLDVLYIQMINSVTKLVLYGVKVGDEAMHKAWEEEMFTEVPSTVQRRCER